MKIELERSGKFRTSFLHGDIDGKCGLPDAQEFSYTVRIYGTDKSLSPEGFIIENSRVQLYFDRTYAHVKQYRSCELIASKAAEALGRKLVSEGISIDKVSATISGTPGAQLTAVWERE